MKTHYFFQFTKNPIWTMVKVGFICFLLALPFGGYLKHRIDDVLHGTWVDPVEEATPSDRPGATQREPKPTPVNHDDLAPLGDLD